MTTLPTDFGAPPPELLDRLVARAAGEALRDVAYARIVSTDR
jgi:hypothetical protein